MIHIRNRAMIKLTEEVSHLLKEVVRTQANVTHLEARLQNLTWETVQRPTYLLRLDRLKAQCPKFNFTLYGDYFYIDQIMGPPGKEKAFALRDLDRLENEIFSAYHKLHCDNQCSSEAPKPRL